MVSGRSFVSSPIWVDWNSDNVLDIVAFSQEGEVLVFTYACSRTRASSIHLSLVVKANCGRTRRRAFQSFQSFARGITASTDLASPPRSH